MDELKLPIGQDIDAVASLVSNKIMARLAIGKVLWLLSGGSAIGFEVAVRRNLSSNLDGLSVSLADERYGPLAHPTSNWQQLKSAGFNFSELDSHPLLQAADIDQTTTSFISFLRSSLDSSIYIIGIFGLGSDGHTAGILPHSLAVESPELAVCYDGGEYQRITVTPHFISKVDEAYLYAVGNSKEDQLKKLALQQSVQVQPAQALKQARSLTIINDYEGVLI